MDKIQQKDVKEGHYYCISCYDGNEEIFISFDIVIIWELLSLFGIKYVVLIGIVR